MDTDRYTDEQIRQILSYRNVAIVGMSRDPQKDAHRVPKYLSEQGYSVIPINPHADQILGIRCHPEIGSVDSSVDIVDVFRPSDMVLPIVREAIKKHPKVIWLQEGIYDSEAERLARDAGIEFVFNRCMYAEHRRLCK